MENEETRELQPEPTLGEVLRRLADRMGDDYTAPTRVTIEQGTPWVYACRVYAQGEKDYDGSILMFGD